MKKIRKLSYIFLLISFVLSCAGCQFFQKKMVDVSKKQDWTVKSDPSREKSKEEYDAIIVGSGLGGLTCGSLLAKNGYKVLVLEQSSQVGGYCTSYSRKGFTFPVGAHDVSGCDKGAVRMLLDALDMKKDDFFTLHTRTYVLGDKTIIFTGTKNDVVKKLSELFPNEKTAISSFFHEAEKAMDEKRASRKDPNIPCPTYDQWQKITYQKKLDQFFRGGEVQKFLCSLLGYLGTKPDETVASEALFGVLSYFIYGGYYPKAGGKLFADSLQQYIQSHNGTVLMNTKVDEILVNNNAVTGVRAGNSLFFSSLVVANANAREAFLRLIPSHVLDSGFLDAIRHLKMSLSEATVNIGVDYDLSSLSSIMKIYPTDGKKCSFHINSNADPTMAPSGCSSLSIGVEASYANVPPTNTPEYMVYKEHLAQVAIDKLEKVLPGLREHVIVYDVITPRTYESFTSMPEGAFYSFDQAAGLKRPYFKTPVRGLYLASASTYPGAGVEAVIASGLISACNIMESRVFQKKLLLPPPSLKSNLSIEEAIHTRHSTRRFEVLSLTLSDVGQLLWAAQGVTHAHSLRAAPSAGALYPLEIYLVAENVTDLPSGMYKYHCNEHALEKLKGGHYCQKLYEAANSQKSVEQAAADIILCAVYDKEKKRFGSAAKTLTDIEVGCVAENISLQATSLRIGTVFLAGFDSQSVKELLDFPRDEEPIGILPIGKPRDDS